MSRSKEEIEADIERLGLNFLTGYSGRAEYERDLKLLYAELYSGPQHATSLPHCPTCQCIKLHPVMPTGPNNAKRSRSWHHDRLLSENDLPEKP